MKNKEKDKDRKGQKGAWERIFFDSFLFGKEEEKRGRKKKKKKKEERNESGGFDLGWSVGSIQCLRLLLSCYSVCYCYCRLYVFAICVSIFACSVQH